MARNTHFTGTEVKGNEAVDSGRRDFLSRFTGRRGREPEVEMPQTQQPRNSGGMTRRNLLKGAAGLAGVAVVSKFTTGCDTGLIEVPMPETCEDTIPTERCSYRDANLAVCTVTKNGAIEMDGYLFKVKGMVRSGDSVQVDISIRDTYQDCREIRSITLTVGATQTPVDIAFDRYNIAALDVSFSDSGEPAAITLAVSKDLGYLACSGTLSRAVGPINVGEFLPMGGIKVRLDDIEKYEEDGTTRYRAIFKVLNMSDTEITNLRLTEGESRTFPYDGSRMYKVAAELVARGDLLISKWAVVSISMCE